MVFLVIVYFVHVTCHKIAEYNVRLCTIHLLSNSESPTNKTANTLTKFNIHTTRPTTQPHNPRPKSLVHSQYSYLNIETCLTNISNSNPPNLPIISGTFTKFKLEISPTAINYVLYSRTISDEYEKNLAAEARYETEDPEANSTILQQDGRFLRWEESEVKTEILQHDATFNLQLARSGVEELHLPSRITSNSKKTSVETQSKLWRLLVSNILTYKHIMFILCILHNCQTE